MRANKTSERGSIYIAVLGISMLVVVLGVGGLLAVQVQRREVKEALATEQALLGSRAAIELARLNISTNASWRTDYTSGVWSTAEPFGGGRIQWKLEDEADGNLATNTAKSDPALDPVRVYGMATVGSAVRVTSVVLTGAKVPDDVLRTAIHTQSTFSIPSATYNGNPSLITVTGGPISAKTTVTNAGQIVGDIEANAYAGTGTVTGTKTLSPSLKSIPPASVFTDYLNGSNGSTPATEIPWNNTNFPLASGKYGFNFATLTATMSTPNSIAFNADGLYLIKVPAAAILEIDKCRLSCTLLIDAGVGSTVHLGAQILWEPSRADFPLVIVRGAGTVELEGKGTGGLSEATLSENYNPTGFAYVGATNATMTDTYPATLNGVIHVIGSACTTGLFPEIHTNGCVISEGPVVFPSGGSAAVNATLTVNPAIATNPPRGYYTVLMTSVSNSWRRDAAP